MRNELREIVDVLSTDQHNSPDEALGWRITPISGGANNRLYRITGDTGDYAVKFTIRDARDRAGREYHALRAIESVNADIAPKPVMLDRRRYPQPVVIITWLDGEVTRKMPMTDAEWRCLIEHFTAIHAIKPAHTRVRLRHAWLMSTTRTECRRLINLEAARVPVSDHPASLKRLKALWDALNLPTWSRSALGLCRVDPNILNLVRGVDRWRSVDWENSGWGDPAYEIADLITHPAYMAVDADRWEWTIREYAALTGDDRVLQRIRTYRLTFLMWWCFRFNRYLYEIPRGLDQRLAPRQEGWHERNLMTYEHYLSLAESAIIDGYGN